MKNKNSITDTPETPAARRTRKPTAGLRIVECGPDRTYLGAGPDTEYPDVRTARKALVDIAAPGMTYAIIRVLETGLTVKEEVTRRIV